MRRANFSQRQRLDGPWASGRWRDYFPTKRRDWLTLWIAYACAAASSVTVIWYFWTH